MIAVVATIRVTEGAGAEAEGVLREIATTVKANEPGMIIYQIFRSRTEANCYKVLEIYQDQAALEAHRANPALKGLVPRLGEFKSGPTEAEYFDAID